MSRIKILVLKSRWERALSSVTLSTSALVTTLNRWSFINIDSVTEKVGVLNLSLLGSIFLDQSLKYQNKIL